MRSMQECRDEIFRRGAEKIRKKKQRKKIATGVGMSLCLCLLTLTGIRWGLPLMIDKGAHSLDPTTEATPEWTGAFVPTEAMGTEGFWGDFWYGSHIATGTAPAETEARPAPEAYIYGMGDCAGYYKALLEPDGVLDLLEYLQSLTEFESDDLTEEQDPTGNYYIEILDEAGETWEFTLKDRLLENSNTGNWVILTQEQVSELLSRMGVE